MTVPKPYPEYKGSGIEWIGDAPIEWEVQQIRRLTRVQRGASPRPIDDPIYFDDEGTWGWVRIQDVTASGGCLMTTTQRLSDLGASLSVKLSPGALFLSIAGSVGKPCIAAIDCCIHDGFVFFPSITGSLANFLFRVFETGRPFLGLGKLGTQLNLNTDTVGGVSVAIPPADEIRQILSYLNRETAEVDAFIADQEELIGLLAERRAATISHAVTKGLDPNAPMKDSGSEWIGEVPTAWRLDKLARLFTTIGSGTTPPRDVENYYGGKHPWVTTGELRESRILKTKESITDQALAELSALTLYPKETILIAMYGATVGRLGILGIEATTNQACCALAGPVGARSRFVYYALQAAKSHLLVLADGGGQPNINQEKLRQLRLPKPSLEEQDSIVVHLDHELAELDATIADAQEAIALSRERRAALISAAVTGKIDVREVGVVA